MSKISCFIAYPSQPLTIGDTIENAIENLNGAKCNYDIKTWKASDIAGNFIINGVLSDISSRDCLIADVTHLNFNVLYEIGYAIGNNKKICLIKNSGIISDNDFEKLGIFDTLGIKFYQNSRELIAVIDSIKSIQPLSTDFTINKSSPVYLTDAKIQSDFIIKIKSRIKKAKVFFRSFDPQEKSRLSANEAIKNVSQSYGVLVTLLRKDSVDVRIHNLRSAFIAGLAEGMNKVCLILQDGADPVPIDYRDLAVEISHPNQIQPEIEEFANNIFQEFQQNTKNIILEKQSFLEKLNLGASSAENEASDLEYYYLKTDAYLKAERGEVQLVVGRKGSGKSAIFSRVRDKARANKKNIVLDLRPDGYKLKKFKESVLQLLGEGTLEHTIAAFWEYLLLLEICYKILEKDKVSHIRNHHLYDPYKKLESLYKNDKYLIEGDFSERMSKLMQNISNDYQVLYQNSNNVNLTEPQITDLLYKHDVAELRSQIQNYLKHKDSVWLLFDNLDKGWPSRGLNTVDLVIIRMLIDACRNIQKQFRRNDIETYVILFLRNDVFELLVDETPDRGKESKVLIDWVDADLLRELLRRRIIFNGISQETASFQDLWRELFIPYINGEESSQYLIDRCLMRPRCLLELVDHCKSFAVNLKHDKIELADIEKGISAYSTDLIIGIGYEIRDIDPKVGDILYAFIESKIELTADDLDLILIDHVAESNISEVTDILLWYGFLGIVKQEENITYIYSVNYDMRILKGMIKKINRDNLLYAINPAFWSGLKLVL